eukprot:9884977-Karenia_brevis.AAC.1
MCVVVPSANTYLQKSVCLVKFHCVMNAFAILEAGAGIPKALTNDIIIGVANEFLAKEKVV